MLFEFFISTNKTFNLLPKNNYLENLPQMCCSKSKSYPHILPEISRVFPQIKYPDQESTVPLFSAMVKNAPLTYNEIDESKKFYLVFFPNIDEFPSNVNEPHEKEYWSQIQPMIICRGMGNYYLGKLDDENKILFRACSPESSPESSQGWINPVDLVKDKSKIVTCYQKGVESDDSKKIYIRKADI